MNKGRSKSNEKRDAYTFSNSTAYTFSFNHWNALIPMHFNCKSIRTYFQKKAQSGDLRPQLTDTSGDWFKQTTAAAVEKRQERRVEIEQSWGEGGGGEGGGIVLASCHSFSFAIEIKRKRKKEVR
ncbi:hypothetical protein Rs2_41983 [Raphanus sativus]|nr:hypothetical protein Rs2_41983 [Raphanus sativus]